MEAISKNTANLSQQEKLDIVANESPEFLELIEDLREKIADIRNNVQPLYEK